MTFRTFDLHIIHFFKKVSDPFARASFFVIFFWFGALKIAGLSPAGELVETLFSQIGPEFIDFNTFMSLFGFYECIIGVLFLFPKFGRVALFLMLAHMMLTSLPLVLLPQMIWSGFLIPTLEGQYIIKNLALIAAVMGIMAHLHPISAHHLHRK